MGVIFSYHSSSRGIDYARFCAGKYYLEGKDDYINKKNISRELTNWLNIISSFCFILGIIFIIKFVVTY